MLTYANMPSLLLLCRYENNVALLQNRDAIQQRFALLPLATRSVGVEYENPVVLGATTSGWV